MAGPVTHRPVTRDIAQHTARRGTKRTITNAPSRDAKLLRMSSKQRRKEPATNLPVYESLPPTWLPKTHKSGDLGTLDDALYRLYLIGL